MMQVVNSETAYDEMLKIAKRLKIQYVGVRKPQLIEKINSTVTQAMDLIGETEVNEDAEVTNEENNNVSQEQEHKELEQEEHKETTSARVKKTKWYDEEDAELPYAAGDIVEVHSGEILVGRRAQVVKMSAKRNAIKAILIHPVKGTLQNCLITLDYNKIQMAEDQTPPRDTVTIRKSIEESIEEATEERDENEQHENEPEAV